MSTAFAYPDGFLQALLPGDFDRRRCHVFELFRNEANAPRVAALEQFIRDMEFSYVKFLGHGRFAVGFEVAPGLVLRISLGEGARGTQPGILQPFATGEIGYCRVELLQQLAIDVNPQHLEDVTQAQEIAGYQIDDVSLHKNLGHIWVPSHGDVGLIYDAEGGKKRWKPFARTPRVDYAQVERDIDAACYERLRHDSAAYARVICSELERKYAEEVAVETPYWAASVAGSGQAAAAAGV